MPGGGEVLILTWYTYKFLPFEVLFCEIRFSDQWVYIGDEGAQIT